MCSPVMSGRRGDGERRIDLWHTGLHGSEHGRTLLAKSITEERRPAALYFRMHVVSFREDQRCATQRVRRPIPCATSNCTLHGQIATVGFFLISAHGRVRMCNSLVTYTSK